MELFFIPCLFRFVYLCSLLCRIDVNTRQTVAVKIIDLENAEDEIEDIQQEIKVLSQCESPYVTKYFGSYLMKSNLWIVMEYLGGGSCLDLLEVRPFEEVYASAIVKSILKGTPWLYCCSCWIQLLLKCYRFGVSS